MRIATSAILGNSGDKLTEPRSRVFVSSVMEDYRGIRDAASRGIRQAGCEPVRAEDFSAASASPRNACLDGVRSTDALVLLLGAHYGFVGPAGLLLRRQTGIGTPPACRGGLFRRFCGLIGRLMDRGGRLTRAWGFKWTPTALVGSIALCPPKASAGRRLPGHRRRLRLVDGRRALERLSPGGVESCPTVAEAHRRRRHVHCAYRSGGRITSRSAVRLDGSRCRDQGGLHREGARG